MVARLIAARSQRWNPKRQVFLVSLGGGPPDNLMDRHPALLTELGGAAEQLFSRRWNPSAWARSPPSGDSDFGRTLVLRDSSRPRLGQPPRKGAGWRGARRLHGQAPPGMLPGPEDVSQGPAAAETPPSTSTPPRWRAVVRCPATCQAPGGARHRQFGTLTWAGRTHEPPARDELDSPGATRWSGAADRWPASWAGSASTLIIVPWQQQRTDPVAAAGSCATAVWRSRCATPCSPLDGVLA